MFHETYHPVAMLVDEGVAAATSDYICVKHANWVTLLIIEDNLSGAGTAHNWSVLTRDYVASGTGDTVEGIEVWSETDIAAGTLLDTLAATTVTTGVFAADVSASTWSIHVVEIDPAVLGDNTTSGSPNDWIACYSSAASANSNVMILAVLDVRHKQAIPPTAVS